ncbi:hypothetical protein Tco_1109908 [Tanacetum coccineum]|uniref:Uncharacterized protein n=1 Tax=Tanacetum coccineum TaxID=301880 RepID=A0ABQ5IIP8_9ASTR
MERPIWTVKERKRIYNTSVFGFCAILPMDSMTLCNVKAKADIGIFVGLHHQEGDNRIYNNMHKIEETLCLPSMNLRRLSYSNSSGCHLNPDFCANVDDLFQWFDDDRSHSLQLFDTSRQLLTLLGPECPMVTFHNKGISEGAPNFNQALEIRAGLRLCRKTIMSLNVLKNKARLVGRICQEAVSDFEESFAPDARLEAIRLFIAYATNSNLLGIGLLVVIQKSRISPAIPQQKVNTLPIQDAVLNSFGCVLNSETMDFVFNKIPIYCDKQKCYCSMLNSVSQLAFQDIDIRTTYQRAEKQSNHGLSEVPLKRKDQVALDEDLARNLQAQLEAELIEEERLARKKEEEANIALIESWDNTQAIMEADFELAQKLQTEEQGEITIEERSKLFVELEQRKGRKHFANA